MLNQGDGDGATPLTDSLVSAIAGSSGVTEDQVTIEYSCEERRAMSLAIRFSITLSASDLEPTSVAAGEKSQAQQLVGLLNSAVSSGSFAAAVSNEAAQRGEVVAVQATILESVCLTCDIEEVIITNIQVSESFYVGTVVLLLLVAVPLFFGELAIFIGLRTLHPCRTYEQPSLEQPSCRTLHLCETQQPLQFEQEPTGKVSKQEWVTYYGSDAGFDRYSADGDIASGRPSHMLAHQLFVSVSLLGIETACGCCR